MKPQHTSLAFARWGTSILQCSDTWCCVVWEAGSTISHECALPSSGQTSPPPLTEAQAVPKCWYPHKLHRITQENTIFLIYTNNMALWEFGRGSTQCQHYKIYDISKRSKFYVIFIQYRDLLRKYTGLNINKTNVRISTCPYGIGTSGKNKRITLIISNPAFVSILHHCQNPRNINLKAETEVVNNKVPKR
jgi:hypothetical protein